MLGLQVVARQAAVRREAVRVAAVLQATEQTSAQGSTAVS
jgi:hypothetical protein